MEVWRGLSMVFALPLLLCLFLAVTTNSASSGTRLALTSNGTTGKNHSEGYCAMYDICGVRSDGKVLNCPFGSPSVKPDDLFSSKIQSLCPTITGNVCCTERQFETLKAQVQQAVPLLVGCPACLRNFLNLFCELTCSPNQSQFIDVTSVHGVGKNKTVDGIDYFITDNFGAGMFESCKDVKFGSMNTRAIEFVGGGAKTFGEWYTFLGTQASPGVPGSPYSINFTSYAPDSSGMKPMNVSTYSCGDTSLGCSCGDCLNSPVCSGSAPPTPHEKGSCSMRIGPIKAKCIEVAMAISYIVLVSLFLGWGFVHRKKEKTTASRSKPLINATDIGVVRNRSRQKK